MEKEMSTLLGSASLFEVNVPDFKQLKQCRKELKLLKMLWDYVIMVRSSIDDWKTTPWKEINVEQMDMDCKKFAKDIRALDKEMRAWDTYTGVENVVKNMLTSLRAVSELQNPAIRERHWQQLMAATKVWYAFKKEGTHLSHLMTKPTKWSVCPGKTQISPVWLESSLSVWRNIGSLATHWAHSEDWSDWADALADLNLRWAHMSFCWFYHEAAHFCFISNRNN